MKKYFAYAFVFAGMLTALVSCAPVIRAPFQGAADGSISIDSSFLGAAMLLAFACLCAIVGVLMFARQSTRRFIENPDQEPPRLVATLLNLSPIMLFTGLPMIHLLVPLWIVSRSRNAALGREAVRVLNFQITWTLFAVVALILCTVIVGVLLLAVLLVFHVVVTLRAAWRASHGRAGEFPLSIRFVE